jgi:hypothetical protein
MENIKSISSLISIVALGFLAYNRFLKNEENIPEHSYDLENINLPEYLNSTSSNSLHTDPPEYQIKDIAIPNFEQPKATNYNIKELQESLNKQPSHESVEKLIELSKKMDNDKLKSIEVGCRSFELNQNNNPLNKLQPVKLTTDLIENGPNKKNISIKRMVENN